MIHCAGTQDRRRRTVEEEEIAPPDSHRPGDVAPGALRDASLAFSLLI